MTTPKKKVLITGASGLIGGLVLKGPGDKYEFSALNRRPVDGGFQTPKVTSRTSMQSCRLLKALIPSCISQPAYTEDVHEWEGTERVNIRGAHNVYEAARIHGVKRVIFASSGGTMLGYEP